jgi:hypothetical protein
MLAQNNKSKKLKANNDKSCKAIKDGMSDLDSDNFFSQKSVKEAPKPQGMHNEKDNPYTIFHALGKFLYNKSKYQTNSKCICRS